MLARGEEGIREGRKEEGGGKNKRGAARVRARPGAIKKLALAAKRETTGALAVAAALARPRQDLKLK